MDGLMIDGSVESLVLSLESQTVERWVDAKGVLMAG